MPMCSETAAICPSLLMSTLYNMAVYGMNVALLVSLLLVTLVPKAAFHCSVDTYHISGLGFSLPKAFYVL